MWRHLAIFLLFIFAAITGTAQQQKLTFSKINHSKPDTNKISLFIKLGNNYADQSSSIKPKLDSALVCYNLALKLSNTLNERAWRLKTLEEIAYYYYQIGNPFKAIKAEQQLVQIYQARKDLYNEAAAWQSIGAYSDDLRFAQVCYKKAQILFEKAGNKPAAIAALKEFGDNYKKRSELDSATAVLKDVIRQYQQIGYKKQQSTYDLIATIANIQGRINDELINRIACVKSMEASGDFTNAVLYYDGLSYDYWRFHQYTQCLVYAQKCFKYGDRARCYPTLGLVTSSFLLLNKPAEALAFLKKATKLYAPTAQGEKDLVQGLLYHTNNALKNKDDKPNADQNLELQTELMEQMSAYYSTIGYNVAAVQIETEVIKFYHARKDINKEANAWLTLGKYSTDMAHSDACFYKARALFKQTGDNINEMATLCKVGINLYHQGKTDSAEIILTQVIQVYRSIGYQKDIHEIYNTLSDISSQKGHINEALYYRLAALKNLEASGNVNDIANCYDLLARDYYALKKYKETLYYANKVFTIEGKNFNYAQASRIIFSLLYLKRPTEALTFLKKLVLVKPPVSIGDKEHVNYELGTIYSIFRQNKKAEEYYLRSIKFESLNRPKPKDIDNNSNSYLNIYLTIIHFYNDTKQYQKSRHYLNNIPDSLDKFIHPSKLAFLNYERFKVDSASGNYVRAINYYERYRHENDSLFNAKSISNAEEQQNKYDRNKRDQAISMLESDQRVGKMNTQRAVTQRNLTLAAIFVALMIAGVIYYSYRRKMQSGLIISQKNNQLEMLLHDREHSNELINKKNDELQQLLVEKDWLLKEVHHRVKNNLHTVFCLLESQAKYLSDDALKAVEVSQHRIYAMSLIHQKLYQSEDIKTVDISLYLSEFIGYLMESFDTDGRIRFNLDIEPITLDITQAIPVALIINEAVTNAIKYAFPDGKSGMIEISFHQSAENLKLKVIDNGIGIGTIPDLEQLNSLGLVLMRGLTEDLHGTFSIKNKNGTNIKIVFPAITILAS